MITPLIRHVTDSTAFLCTNSTAGRPSPTSLQESRTEERQRVGVPSDVPDIEPLSPEHFLKPFYVVGLGVSSSFGFWRIKNDDEECGDWPQEKGHNPPIQTASALRLREARVYEGESRPANCILTCFANHHQTPRGIRSPARVLSNPKRRLLQSAGIDYTRK